MTRPKVSIVVPVYNTQTMLRECMDSLLAQTLQEIEIILIDDGSTDGSGKMCDTYIYDSRVKVVHKKNGGLSSARNIGLDVVTGEYVGFVDSDDYVDTSMFKKMYEKASMSNADICICAHCTVDNEGTKKMHYHKGLPENIKNDMIEKKLILPLIGKNMQKGDSEVEGFVWRNLYKREIMERNRFLSEREFFAEDVIFNLTVYAQCKQICVLNECLYYYRYNETSLSNKYRENVENLLGNLLEWEYNYMEKNYIPKEEYCRLYATGIKFILFSIRNLQKENCKLSKKEKKHIIKKMLQREIFHKCIKNIDCRVCDLKIHIFVMLCKLKFTTMLNRI